MRRADPAERAGPGEEFLGQGLVATVDQGHRCEASASIGCIELRDEPEVVVEHAWMDGLRRHVDDTGPRSAQKAEHEAEEALFVRGEDRDQVIGNVEADRVHDDDGALDIADRAEGHCRPEGAQLGLQLGEGRVGHDATLPQWQSESRGMALVA